MVFTASADYQDEPLDMRIRPQQPSSPLNLTMGRQYYHLSQDDAFVDNSSTIDSIIVDITHIDDDESSVDEPPSVEIFLDDETPAELDVSVILIDSDTDVLPDSSFDEPLAGSRKRKMSPSASSTPRSYRCQACGVEKKKNHDVICPAHFEISNPMARIVEISERFYWRHRDFERKGDEPFFYRVRWSVEGERKLIPHKELLDYCPRRLLESFNSRFCDDCGLDKSGSDRHHFCPAHYRSTLPVDCEGFKVVKLLERHYWPNSDRKEEESSCFFKVEWSHPGQPDYVPFNWVMNKRLLSLFRKKNRE